MHTNIRNSADVPANVALVRRYDFSPLARVGRARGVRAECKRLGITSETEIQERILRNERELHAQARETAKVFQSA